ncbi:MAG: N-acetylmuramoyl-L-alanine amidase [Sarcina sp.]
MYIKHIKYNFSKRNDSVKYIVIHQTGNISKGAGVENHFNYFNSGDRQSSAHYFVDDKKIAEFVEPIKNKSWHCGDGKGKFGITNDNSIGIEMCVNIDGHYIKAYNNLVKLVKELMNRFNIAASNVVRHYDASRKNCPQQLIQNYKNINWEKFKQDISDKPVYRVQVGAFTNLDNAKTLVEKLKKDGYSPIIK